MSCRHQCWACWTEHSFWCVPLFCESPTLLWVCPWKSWCCTCWRIKLFSVVRSMVPPSSVVNFWFVKHQCFFVHHILAVSVSAALQAQSLKLSFIVFSRRQSRLMLWIYCSTMSFTVSCSCLPRSRLEICAKVRAELSHKFHWSCQGILTQSRLIEEWRDVHVSCCLRKHKALA